jgi:MraZ protein
MTMPARHRDALQALCGGQLTITRQHEGALYVFPRPAWEVFRERVMQLPVSALGWKSIYLGYAFDAEVDGSSRVLIAPELRAAAGIERDVMLLGMGDRFELWDVARLAAREQAVLAQGVPAAVANLVL